MGNGLLYAQAGCNPLLSSQVPTAGRHQARRESLGLRRGSGACGLVECGAWRLKSPRGPAWPQARWASSGRGGSVRLFLSGSVRFGQVLTGSLRF